MAVGSDVQARLTTDFEEAKADLDRLGYCTIESAISEEFADDIGERVREQAAAEREAGIAHLVEGPNQRVWALVNKGSVFSELLVTPAHLELIGYLLGPDFLLGSLQANIAGCHGDQTIIHCDQQYIPLPYAYPFIAACIWAIDDFVEENGATRVVPGSHLSNAHPDWGNPPETIPIEVPKGAAIVLDGRVWHATGANRTSTPRIGVIADDCRPYMRQQQNHVLITDPEVVERAGPELKTLLGYKAWGPLGWGEHGPTQGFIEKIDRPVGVLRT